MPDAQVGQPAQLGGEVVDELGSTVVVPAHVVVFDGLLDEPSEVNELIDRSGRSVSRSEEWPAVDLADDASVDLDDQIRPDHLEVEDEPARLDRFDNVAQDVHDVLGIDLSE